MLDKVSFSIPPHGEEYRDYKGDPSTYPGLEAPPPDLKVDFSDCKFHEFQVPQKYWSNLTINIKSRHSFNSYFSTQEQRKNKVMFLDHT